MGAAGADREEAVHLGHTDHRPWRAPHATVLHIVACHLIVDNGDAVVAVVAEEEDGEDALGHIHDPEAARREGASHALLTAGHRREPRQDEAMPGGTAHHEEAVLAVEVVEQEEGEALATAPMAATVVGVGIADDCASPWALGKRKLKKKHGLYGRRPWKRCLNCTII
jgi:hypothetical protein